MDQLQRYFIQLSYEGSPFFGWQRQPGKSPTVQKALEETLELLMGYSVAVTGAGRTDTGVHASSYYAHMDLEAGVTLNYPQLCYKLNRMLPPQIAIQKIQKVDSRAHARYSALSRTYQYKICTRKDPFQLGRAWLFEPPLNVSAMQQAADILLNTGDFACFSKSNTQVKTTLCQVSRANWEKNGNLLVFEIRANRFLRNMVRAIVGTLAEVGLGKISLDDFLQILDSRDRRKAGYSVPGHGLYLTQIEYPDDIWQEK